MDLMSSARTLAHGSDVVAAPPRSRSHRRFSTAPAARQASLVANAADNQQGPGSVAAPLTQDQATLTQWPRRQAVCSLLATAATTALWAPTAQASKLPVFADNLWEAMGGGPSDLTFPESFLGVWDVTSTLIQVDTPLGEELVPDMNVVRRARQEDLNNPIQYQVAFIRNPRDGRVIFDRAFNMASMLGHYLNRPTRELLSRVAWNPAAPNILSLVVPGGLSIRTRVTRRSQEQPAADRLDTSEYMEQVFDTSFMSESTGPTPRVKASQCFTKFKWRDESSVPPGQPTIIATQVVSDYLTPMGGDDRAYLTAANRPITKYTYRIAFSRGSTSSSTSSSASTA